VSKGTLIGGIVWVVEIVAYISAMFYTYAPSDFAEWLATLLATFIGAILAVAGGIVLFNFQRHQSDSDRRNQLRRALASEIRASQGILSGDPTPIMSSGTHAVFGEVVLVPLPHVVVEEAARSALFTSAKTDQFFYLAGYIQVHNNELIFLFATRTGFVTDEALRLATKELKERQEDLRKIYEELLSD